MTKVRISAAITVVISVASLLFAETPATPKKYNLSEGRLETIPAKKVKLPFYVYGDESGALSSYIASGYMGDSNSLNTLSMSTDETAPASTGRTGKTSLKVEYSGRGREGWAGLYWLAPANNWGRMKGAGYDLTKADRLTFWIRGEKGGERISVVKVGGVSGPYPDTDSASVGPLVLSKEWEQITIPLAGKDLRHIVGGFMFILRRADNLRGATFYLDEVVFRGQNEKTSAQPQTDFGTAEAAERGPATTFLDDARLVTTAQSANTENKMAMAVPASGGSGSRAMSAVHVPTAEMAKPVRSAPRSGIKTAVKAPAPSIVKPRVSTPRAPAPAAPRSVDLTIAFLEKLPMTWGTGVRWTLIRLLKEYRQGVDRNLISRILAAWGR